MPLESTEIDYNFTRIIIYIYCKNNTVVLINPKLGHLMVEPLIPFISYFRLTHAAYPACAFLVAGIIYYYWLRGATKLNIQQPLLVAVWLFGCCVVLLPRSVCFWPSTDYLFSIGINYFHMDLFFGHILFIFLSTNLFW